MIRDQLRFLARLLANPTNVGAIAPSSARLARAMASEARGRVLELGPGTGVVTEALIEHGIARDHIVSIEVDEAFAALVRSRTGVRVIQGDAFRLAELLGDIRFDAVVSSLPLRNFPSEKRQTLIADALSRLNQGAPFIQFSYGLVPPAPAPEGATVTLAARVWLNLPPAKVWVYRRTAPFGSP